MDKNISIKLPVENFVKGKIFHFRLYSIMSYGPFFFQTGLSLWKITL